MLKAICIALGLCHTVSGKAIVIDGDTVIVENIHVRIHGIDAEEMRETNGRKARNALVTFIGINPIHCELNGDKSYNRYVGICYLASIDIGAEMIRQGYALDCGRYSNGQYRKLEPIGIRLILLQKPYC